MLFLAGALVLAACGSSEDPPDRPTPTPPTPNANPEADAGDDQAVNAGATVTLDGSDSSDAEGAVTYSWTLTPARAGVALSSSTAAQPTFTAPTVTEEVELVFTLTVTDTASATDTDTVTITINAPPEAEAGDNQTVASGATVTLNGTGSTGEGLEYAWTVPEGSNIALSDDDVASPTFAAPAVTANTEYVFTLTVTDDNDATATDTVTITVTAPVTDDEPPTLQSIAYAEDSAPTGPLSEDDEIRFVATFSKAVLVRGMPRLRFLVGGEERFAVPAEGEGTGEGSATLTFVYVVQASDDLQGSVEFPDNPLVLDTEADVAIVSADDPDAAVDENIPADDIEVSEKLKDEVMVEPANVAPTATATGGGSQNTGETITLDGSTSSDTDGTIASYMWTQQSPATPVITLTGEDTAMVTLVVPAVANDTDFVFRLEVTDDDGATATADVTISVAANVAPTATATGGGPKDTGETITLDGSTSSDTDGTIASYMWTQQSPATPVITLTGADTAMVTLVVPAVDNDTDFVFRLEVTDDDGATATADVTISVVPNESPTATATGGGPKNTGETITLDGSTSSDTDGTIASYIWTQQSPATPVITLTGADTAMATLVVPAVADDTDFVFRLEVTDDDGATATADVMISVSGTRPVANAGDDRTVRPNVLIALDGSGSEQTGDDAIDTYSWTQQSPATPVVAFVNATVADPVFRVPNVPDDTVFVFQLEVTSNNGFTHTDTVSITVSRTALIADATVTGVNTDQEATPGAVVTLDGSGSSTAAGTIASYQWTQLSPTSPTLDLADISAQSDGSIVTFTAPAVAMDTNFAFQLEVTGPSGQSATVGVTVTVRNTPPEANAGHVSANAVETLDGSLSTDQGGAVTTYRWTQQIQGTEPMVTLTGADTAMATFSAPVVDSYDDTVLTFRLEVTDDGRLTDTADVEITVPSTKPRALSISGGTVSSGDEVTLDGSASSVGGGATITTYTWTQQMQGTEPMVTITDPDNEGISTFAVPAGTADGVQFAFQLVVVSSTNLSSDSFDVSFTVSDTAPIVMVSRTPADNRVNPGTMVTLTASTTLRGTGSTIKSHSWTQQPAEPAITLDRDDAAAATFMVPVLTQDTTFTFRVEVTDDAGGSGTAVVLITINAPPAIRTNGNQTVNEGAMVTLDGSASTDPSGGSIASRSWAQQSPTGPTEQVTLTGGDSNTATFTAPSDLTADVDYTFVFTATDNENAASTEEVTITVNASPTAALTVANTTVNSGDPIMLDGSTSADPGGGDLTYTWTLVEPPALAEDAEFSEVTPGDRSIVTYTASSNGVDATYVFQLTVTDEDDARDTSDPVTITVNAPPVAQTNGDQEVDGGMTVTLDGSTSTDPTTGDASTITSYQWTQQIQGTEPMVTLTGADTAMATFSAPAVATDTDFVFQLEVTDRSMQSATVDVTVTVRNTPPEANVGEEDRSVSANAVETLDGSLSTDQGGAVTTYRWTQQIQDGEPTIALTGADTAMATFSAPAVDSYDDTVFTFRLEVTDGGGLTDTADVEITVPSTKPRAASSSGGTVSSAQEVTLDSSGSSVGGGATITTYTWTQQTTGAPTVEITEPDNEGRSTFTVPDDATDGTIFMFQLVVVSSTNLSSDPHVVSFTVSNTAPTVVVGRTPINARVNPGTVVTLNSTGTAPRGTRTIESYSWTQLPPVESAIVLEDDDKATATFTVPALTQDTAVRFQLEVTDDAPTPESGTAVLLITINAPPAIQTNGDQTVNEGATVMLDGSGSSDPSAGGSIASRSWAQKSPEGPTEQVTLMGGDSNMATFIAPDDIDVDTVYTFVFTATDNENAASTEEVTITVNASPTAALTVANTTVNSGDPITLDGSTSTDPGGGDLTYTWTLVQPSALAGAAEFSEVTEDVPSIVTYTASSSGEDATYIFQLTVTDERGATDTIDSVMITVNAPPVAQTNGDQEVDEGAPVTLDGSTSIDPTIGDATTITSYSWAGQGSASSITLTEVTAGDASMVTFTAPAVTTNTNFVFQLEVTDRSGLSGTVEVTVTVRNTPPEANAGEDRSVNATIVETLDGSASEDTGGTITTYMWTQQPTTPPTTPTAPTVTISEPNTAMATFTAPVVDSYENTVLTFQLEVTNDGELTDTDDVKITVPSTKPTAASSNSGTVSSNQVVTLDGSTSSVGGGATITTYTWTQQIQDGEPTVEISEPDNEGRATFTVPDATAGGIIFTFHLVVESSTELESDPLPVSLTVSNTAPIVEAGSDLATPEANPGTEVTLTASTTLRGMDRDISSHLWTQLEPTVPVYTFDPDDAATATFTVPVLTEDTTFIFQVEVTDDATEPESGTDTVAIAVNAPPIIQTNGAQTVNESATVTLDGSDSSDPSSGSIETYAWAQKSPASPTLDLDDISEDDDGSIVTFTAPSDLTANVDYTFTFTATDNDDATSTEEVTITINASPTADLMAATTVNSGDPMTLDGSGSTDPGGGDLTYTWELVQPSALAAVAVFTGVAEDEDDLSIVTYTPPSAAEHTTYTFQLTVTDVNGAMDTSDMVTITVNALPVAQTNDNQEVNEGATVTLDGTTSTDADGMIDTYAWAQESPASPTLPLTDISTDGRTNSIVTFTAPNDIDVDTVYTFVLTVTDDDNAEHTAQVMITINALPTVVIADDDQSVNATDVVTLDGSDSTDGAASNGTSKSIASYLWAPPTPASPTPDLTISAGSGGSIVTFTAPDRAEQTIFTFILTVTDDDGAMSTGQATVTVAASRPPTADAGTDGTVAAGGSFTLSGTASDPEGGEVTFVWQQTAGLRVSLQDENTLTPSFTAPANTLTTTLTFELAVTDPRGLTSKDSVNITVTGGVSKHTVDDHDGAVYDISVSDDGNLAVSGGMDGTVRLWSASSGAAARSLGSHDGPVYAVAISGDGRRAVSGGEDGTLRLWNTDQTDDDASDDNGVYGSEITFTDGRSLADAGAGIWTYAVALNTDGSLAVSGGFDGKVRLWNTTTGAEITFDDGSGGMRSLGTHTVTVTTVDDMDTPATDDDVTTTHTYPVSVYAVAIIDSGNRVLSGGAGGTVRLWNTNEADTTDDADGVYGGQVRELAVPAGGGPIFAVDIVSRDNGDDTTTTIAVAGSADNMVHRWDAGSGNLLGSFAADDNDVTGVAMSPRADRVLSSGGDGYVRLREDDGTAVYAVRLHTDYVWSTALSGNGTIAASASNDGLVHFWAADTAPDGTSDPFTSTATVPEITSANWDGDDTSSEELSDHTDQINGVALSTDGTLLASGSGMESDEEAVPGTMVLHDVGTTTTSLKSGIATMQHPDTILGMALNADGGILASGGIDQHVAFWDTATGRLLFSSRAGFDPHDVALTPNGSLALVPGRAQVIYQWSTNTGEQIFSAPGSVFSNRSVSVSADGLTAVMGNEFATLSRWTRSTQTDQFAPAAPNPTMTDDDPANTIENTTGVALSADGSIAVSGSKDATYMRVWDVTDATLTHRMAGHTDEVSAVDLSSDGRIAISSSADDTVRLWDVATGNLLRTMADHGSSDVNDVAMSGDARIAASGAADGKVRVWRIGRGHARVTTSTAQASAQVLASDGSAILSDEPVTLDELVTLDGSASSGVFAYNWVQTGGPEVALSVVEDDPSKATFSVPTGVYLSTDYTLTFELTATDAGGLLSSKASVTATLTGDVDIFPRNNHGANNPAHSISISNDGSRAVSGGLDGTVRLWDAFTGTETTFGTRRESLGSLDDAVYAVAISGDGKRAISGGADGVLRLWDTDPLSQTSRGEIEFGSDDRSLAENGAGIWIYAVALNNDGTRAVSGGLDGKVRLWNTDQTDSDDDANGVYGDEITFDDGSGGTRSLGSHTATDDNNTPTNTADDFTYPTSVYAVDISADGNRVLSGGADGTVRVWNADPDATGYGSEERELTVPDGGSNAVLGPIFAVGLSSDGGNAVAGSADNEVHRWNPGTDTGTHLGSFAADPANAVDVTGVAVSDNGNRVLSAHGGHLRLRDSDGSNVKTVRLHTDAVWSVALSGDGNVAASAGADGLVNFWATGATLSDVSGTYESTVLEIVPEDTTTPANVNWDGDDILSEAISDHGSSVVRSVALSMDGTRLATGGDHEGNKILLHNVGAATTTLTEGIDMNADINEMKHSDTIWSLALSSNGRLLASGSKDQTVRFWDTATGDQLHSSNSHGDDVFGVTLSPDGNLAVSVGKDGNTGISRVWDTNTGTPRDAATANFPIWSAGVSLNGRTAVVGGEANKLDVWTWDVGTGTFVKRDTAPGMRNELIDAATNFNISHTTGVALSADGRTAVSGSKDGGTTNTSTPYVRVWDVPTGELRHRMERHHTHEVLGLDMDLDGRIAISGSMDATVRLWDVATGKLLRTMTDHDGSGVHSVSMNGDGRIAAAGGAGGKAYVWRIGRGHKRITTSIAVADASGPRAVSSGNEGRLNGSGSENAAVHHWRQTAGPEVALSVHGSDPDDAIFTVPAGILSSSLTFELTVTDAKGLVSNTKSSVTVEVDGEDVFSTQFLDDDREPIPVHGISLSTDDNLAVTGGLDGTVRLWDALRGTEITFGSGAAARALGSHDEAVYAVAVSGDGRRAISGGVDGTIRLWNTDQTDSNDDTNGVYGDEITYGSDRSLAEDGAGIWIYALALNKDGTRAVSGGLDGKVRLWNTATTGTGAGTEIVRFGSETSDRSLGSHAVTDGTYPVSVYAVDISDDGNRVLSGGADGTVRVWSTTSGMQERELTVDAGDGSNAVLGPIFAVDLGTGENSDGETTTIAVAGSADNEVHRWDADDGDHEGSFTADNNDVTGVAMSANGSHVLSADGGTLRWRMSNGTSVHAVRLHTDYVWSVALSGDGAIAASAGNDGRVNFWATSTEPDDILETYTSKVLEIVPEDATTPANVNWDGDDLSRQQFTQPTGRIRVMNMSADGSLLVAGESSGEIRSFEVGDTTTSITNITSMDHGHDQAVWGTALSADGSILVSGGFDNRVRFWNTADGTQLRADGTTHSGGVLRVAVTPDGRTALSGSNDDRVVTWDTTTDTSPDRAGAPTAGGDVWGVALSADGLTAVTGGSDDEMTVWTRTAATAAFAKRATDATMTDTDLVDITEVALSVDGSIAVSGSKDGGSSATTGYVRVWDVTTGTFVRRMEHHHGNEVLAVDLGSDGRLAISGSRDRTARLWDVTTGKLLRTMGGHGGDVSAVSMSGDGRILASGTSTSNVYVWRIGRGHGGTTTSDAVADAGSDGTAMAGTEVTLDGSDSDNAAFYQWRQTSGPEVTLSTVADDPSKATFTPPSGYLAIPYTFELTVIDARGLVGAKDLVTVEVTGEDLFKKEDHDGAVHGISMSTDGSRAVSGGLDGTVRLWNVLTGTEETFGGGMMSSLGSHDGAVYAVAISGDGTRAISGGYDGDLRLWNTVDGTEIVRFGSETSDRSLAEAGAGIWIYALALNDDGSRAVSGGLDGQVRLWDTATGAEITFDDGSGGMRSLGSHDFLDDNGTALDDTDDITYPASVYAVDISNDGNRVLSGGADGTVQLWNTDEGDGAYGANVRELSVSGATLGPIFAVDLGIRDNGDDTTTTTAVAGSADNRVHRWNAGNGNLEGSFDAGAADVTGVAMGANGSRVLSADGGTLRWRMSNGTSVRAARLHTDAVWSVALSDDGRYAASAGNDGVVNFWATSQALSDVSGAYNSTVLEIVPEDATTPANVNWNGDDMVNQQLTGPTGTISAVAMSTDGTRIASGGDGDSNRIWLHDVNLEAVTATATTGITTPMRHDGKVWSVALNANGTMLASASNDNSVRFWNTSNGTRRHGDITPDPTHHTDDVFGVTLSPDGSTALSGGKDDRVIVWNTDTGMPLPNSGTTGSNVWGLSMSLNGLTAVTGGEDNELTVWTRTSHAESFTERENNATLTDADEAITFITRLALSGDGNIAFSGSKDGGSTPGSTTPYLRVWDVAAGTLETPPVERAHSNEVLGVAMSLDGRLAISGSSDQTVRLWDVAAGKLLRTVTVHSGDTVESVSMNGDGRFAVSSDHSGDVRLWRIGRGHSMAPPALSTNAAVVSTNPMGPVDATGGEVTVTLDGSASSDGVAYRWRQISGPNVELSPLVSDPPLPSDSKNATFTTTEPGENVFIFRFTVTAADGSYATSDDVTLTIDGPALTHRKFDDPVRTVAISDDGSRAVSGGDDGIVRLWNMAEKEEITFGMDEDSLGNHTEGDFTYPVHAVAISGDASVVISATFNGYVRVWNTMTGAEITYGEGNDPLYSPLESDNMLAVHDVAINNDGTRAVLVGFDGTARYYNTSSTGDGSGEEIMFGPESDQHLYSPATTVASDDRRSIYAVDIGGINDANVVFGDADGNVRFVTIDESASTATSLLIGTHAGPVHSVSLQANGARVLTGGADNEVALRLTSLNGGNFDKPWGRYHARDVTGVSLGANRAVSVGEDGAIYVRRWTVGGPVPNHQNGLFITAIDDRGDADEARECSLDDPDACPRYDDHAYSIAMAPTGSNPNVITGSLDGTVRFLTLNDDLSAEITPSNASTNFDLSLYPDIVAEPGSGSSTEGIAFHVTPNGAPVSSAIQVVLSVSGEEATAGATNDFAAVSNITFTIAANATSSGSEYDDVQTKISLTVHSDSDDTEDDERIKVTATLTGGLTATSTGYITIKGTRFPSDVTPTILTDRDNTGNPTHGGNVTAAAISYDGTRALTGSSDSELIFWNTQTADAVWRDGVHRNDIRAVDLSADGTKAVSADRTVNGDTYIWNTASRSRDRISIRERGRSVHDVSMDADGDTVAMAMARSHLYVFEGTEEIVKIDLHSSTSSGGINAGRPNRVALGDSGDRVLVGTQTGFLIGYDISDCGPGALKCTTYAYITRFLGTRAETGFENLLGIALSGDGLHAAAGNKLDNAWVIPDGAGWPAGDVAPPGGQVIGGSLWTRNEGADVQDVSLTRHSRLMVNAGDDHNVNLLVGVTNTATLLRELKYLNDAGNEVDVNAVMITPDGRFIVSGHDGGTVIFWRLGRR